MTTITITISREDAVILLSRTRQIASVNEAIARKYAHMDAHFVKDSKAKSDTFGRISAQLDSKLEQPGTNTDCGDPSCRECEWREEYKKVVGGLS